MPRIARALVLGTVAATGAGAGVALTAPPATAHPLGNLTVNTYAGILVGTGEIRVDYVLDLAELPTVQARPRIDADGDGVLSTAESTAYGDHECASLAGGLVVTLASEPVPLGVVRGLVRFLPGQGGLETLRLECSLAAPTTLAATAELTFEDHNLRDRIGWREITLNGDGTTVSRSDAASASSSGRLLAYPGSGSSPPRELAASAELRPGGPRLAPDGTPAPPTDRPQNRGADPLTAWFQQAVGDRELTAGVAAVALLAAIALGALHAMAPGHGKTMMAAYVVGRQGTGRQVAAIGLTVALTHTGGVLALGTIIWASQALAPDRVLPWLTVASGTLLAACGVALLYRRVVLGRTGHSHLHLPGQAAHDHHDHHHHDHEHDHGHTHGHTRHHGHGHGHGHDDHLTDHGDAPPFRRAWLILMGVAGGLVPTPSALVVLLGAMALHRTWFGVVVVGLYGLGMAAALMGAGLLLVRLQVWLEGHWYARPRAMLALRYLPAVTALLLVGGGLSVVLRGAAQL